ncbi:peroxiredoxin [Ferrovum sp. PN-J185]|uniref:peroxiredoxin n=1 Tax=Ferrovum sp. PN-J185 TaxID=1356306 RepID=UPI000797DA0F|nr:peroxiredoxin [Ferrovum sp. PN-J185]KXW56715.1 putative peroxiredoxin bcp [Ferrovum sp. PN-J185]MCC6067600.1 peroxiredoxin [Ferrovum sp. PN-J185]
MELMTSVPDFELAATGGLKFQLSAMKGAPLVLYFYPKDDTPGCTDEGLQFKSLYEEFKTLKCSILGISRDSLSSHEKFKSKFDYPFPLLSDPDEIACNIFDVIKMKNMYGKQVRGIQRSTFVIDKEGKLRKEWRGVSVPGHAQAVLDFIKTL